MTKFFTIGDSRFIPDWLMDYISENAVITHRDDGQFWKAPFTSAHVMTKDGFVTAREGDTIVCIHDGSLEVRKKVIPYVPKDCMVVHSSSNVN